MASPGIRVLVHEKPDRRGTWDPHGVDGWCMGPSLNHYRCYKTHITKTKGERITDTLCWFPHYVKMPSSSNLDYLAATTKDLLTSTKQLNQDSPLDPFTDSEKQTMENFAKIFENKTQSKDPPPNETKVKKMSLENDEAPALPLRVATEEPNAVPQRVQIEAAEPPPIQEHPTAPPRVQTEDTNLENVPDPDPVASHPTQERQ